MPTEIQSSKYLYEIIVPTIYGDTLKPISTKHHKNWDTEVRKITGGLTIYQPAKGQWVHESDLCEERVIPVRIACAPRDIDRIIAFTLKHYRQKAVFYYLVSQHCFTVFA
jgi:hypothetical protein